MPAIALNQELRQNKRDFSGSRKKRRCGRCESYLFTRGARHDRNMLDSLTVGRRIRQLRSDRGLTLDALGTAIGRAASQVSVVENGKRELKLGEMQKFADALDVTVEQLLSDEAPSERAALEIALERIQRGQLYATLGLPPVAVRKALSDEAIQTILGLHAELERMHG